MFAMTAVKKAATYGYKKYGIPGAIATGLGTLLGIRFIKRKLFSGSSSDDDEIDVSEESDDGSSAAN
ncbi:MULTISPECIES: hypothetical protein [Halococcus]|uniref:Uncharacterized protein n=1 Tax=Halococcus salifodinae DSM 8989 TaxID=1227456 RepID=M0N766_9EURY|nr:MULTISPECIES: hypothetical protein [Halococcus]EMA53716.1 hypothetical protein C450_07402 [Halococcus salifodinae DSM 8989]